MLAIDSAATECAQQLLDFIDVSPSPWHAVATMEELLLNHGFQRLSPGERWSLTAGGRYFTLQDDASIIAFIVGQAALEEHGFQIIGAHTDSPGLRVKPSVPTSTNSIAQLGVDVYGGPILATFTDRDLSLAGRVVVKQPDGELVSRLIRFEQPLLRLPNLAIHMNRKVNEEGLRLDKQNELAPILTQLEASLAPHDHFVALLAEQLDVAVEAISGWELNLYDTQKGALWGVNNRFIASRQLDNLASCHAALSALLSEPLLDGIDHTAVCAFFDHEEVGSESMKGAAGPLLSTVLERIALAQGLDRQRYHQALANSFLISADMAHSFHPNFSAAYEPDHKVMVNQGPVIKTNANQRYSSEALSEARFKQLCEAVNVPWQHYSHRSDIPCGSTIGPILSAGLGIRTVDVGNPMWAMHSVRESAGVADHLAIIAVFQHFFKGSV